MQGDLPGDDFLQREGRVGLKIADQDDLPAFAHGPDGEIEWCGGTDDFKAGVCAIATADFANVRGKVFLLGVEGIAGTEFEGELEATVVEINGDDAIPATGFEGLDDKQADEARADDDCGAAVLWLAISLRLAVGVIPGL